MLTIIMLILLALVVLVIAAWWLFEIDVPDVVIAGTAPAAGLHHLFLRHAAVLGDRCGAVPHRRRVPDLQMDAQFEAGLGHRAQVTDVVIPAKAGIQ